MPALATSTRAAGVIDRLIGDLAETVRSWSEFEVRVRCSNTAVVAIDRSGGAPQVERLEHLTRNGVSTHFVLLIDDEIVDDDVLGRIAVAKVIRFSRAARLLRSAVQDFSSRAHLGRVVDRFVAADHVSPVVRRGVRIACVGPLPVPTIARLAEAVGCSRRTLSREWRRGTATGIPVALDDLLAWIALLRALALRPRYRTWEDTALACRIGRSTLHRHARRLLDLPLGDLEFDETLTRCMEVVEALLERSVPK